MTQSPEFHCIASPLYVKQVYHTVPIFVPLFSIILALRTISQTRLASAFYHHSHLSDWDLLAAQLRAVLARALSALRTKTFATRLKDLRMINCEPDVMKSNVALGRT